MGYDRVFYTIGVPLMDERMQTNPAPLVQALKTYQHGGWTRHIGARAELQADQPILRLPYQDRNLNADGGVVHGGIIATLLHDAGHLAVQATLTDEMDAPIRVLGCQVSYLQAARGIDLQASAIVKRQGRRFQFVAAEVRDPQGQLIATADLVFGLDNVPSITSSDAYTLEQVRAGEPHRLAQLFNANLAKRLPGMTILGMHKGYCGIKVEDQPHFQDAHGNFAAGLQLLAADNAGVFAAFALGGRVKKASTVELKLSFCRVARVQPIVAVGYSVGSAEDIIFNRIDIFDEETQELIAYGVMTFLQ
jgi:uncharacterized protein (TIGR00369 family)